MVFLHISPILLPEPCQRQYTGDMKSICFAVLVLLLGFTASVAEAAVFRVEFPHWRVTYIGYPGYRTISDTELIISRAWPAEPFAWDAPEPAISFTFTDSKHPDYEYTYDAHLPDVPGDRMWIMIVRQPVISYPSGVTSLMLGGTSYLGGISSFLIGASHGYEAGMLQLAAAGGAVFRMLELSAGAIESEPSDYVHLAGKYFRDGTPVSVTSWSSLGYWVHADASLFFCDHAALHFMGGYISEAVFRQFTFNAGSTPLEQQKKGPVTVNGSLLGGLGVLIRW